jgi:hypothetical protein
MKEAEDAPQKHPESSHKRRLEGVPTLGYSDKEY